MERWKDIPMEKILHQKYPAKEHAKKVARYLQAQGASLDGMIYLEGQKTRMIEDCDQEAPFRQRRHFYYLSGCELPDCSLIYYLNTDRLTLFIPSIDRSSVIWSGLPITPGEAIARYDVDAVSLTTSLASCLTPPRSGKAHPARIIYTITAHNASSSLPSSSNICALPALQPAIDHCRISKDAYEIALIRHANAITTAAHTAALHAAHHAPSEQALHAVFLARCLAAGAPNQAYAPIVASGRHAATLHYGRNDTALDPGANPLVLLDAGAEFRCYAADVTRTFPPSGRFSPEARATYDLVLRMQSASLALLKAGVSWDRVHTHAHEVAIAGLCELGILKGEPAAILAARTSVAFFPHGLGHYLGLDTHDVGGGANYEDEDPMFRFLRVRGALPEGSVVTVEPGIYFCPFILDSYLEHETHGKFIDRGVLDRYWDVGGVRIEDNILITQTGYENLTTAVKDAEEMEKIINSS